MENGDGKFPAGFVPQKALPRNATARERRGRAAEEMKPTAKVELGKVTVFRTAATADGSKDVPLVKALKTIRGKRYASAVAAIRSETDKKKRTELKSRNLAFGTNGTFAGGHADADRLTFAGFMIWDFDRKENPETDFEELRARATELPFCIAAFDSPTDGLKVLIRTDEQDYEAFHEESRLFLGLLMGGGAVPQVKVKADGGHAATQYFYFSSDAKIWIHPEAADLSKIPPMPSGNASLERNFPARAAKVLFRHFFENYFYGGKDVFYERVVPAVISAPHFQEIQRAALKIELMRNEGVTPKMAAQIARAIEKENAATFVCYARSCTPAGFYRNAIFSNRQNTLVLTSPNPVKAMANGNFPAVRELLETIWPPDSAGASENCLRFLGWLRHARRAVEAAILSGGILYTPTPFLGLLGTTGAGKDLLFETVIMPVLSGRAWAGMASFTQDEPWLDAVTGAEVLFVSELKNLILKERQVYKSRVKSVLSGKFTANGKFKAQYSATTQHILVQLANIDENGNCIDSIPDTAEDIADKMLLLSLTNSAGVQAKYTAADREKNAEAIARDLPAFVGWLLGMNGASATFSQDEANFAYPEELTAPRFGVIGWISPEVQAAQHEANTDGAESLHTVFQGIFSAHKWPSLTFGPVTALELNSELAEMRAEDNPPIIRELRQHNPIALGRAVSALCRSYPSLYRRERNSEDGRTVFTISAPDPTEAGVRPSFESDSAREWIHPMLFVPFFETAEETTEAEIA